MSEEKAPVIPEFLACSRCGISYEKHRYFFQDYRARVCRNCEEGNEPDSSRDFIMSTDTDIESKIRLEERDKCEERRIDVLEIALDKKKKKAKSVDEKVIDECLLKSEDLKAQTTLKRYGRKKR